MSVRYALPSPHNLTTVVIEPRSEEACAKELCAEELPSGGHSGEAIVLGFWK